MLNQSMRTTCRHILMDVEYTMYSLGLLYIIVSYHNIKHITNFIET
jgi:hypothetical protein